MINLIHIDCMKYMAAQEDNVFDLAIVDPPYGLGEAGKRSGTRSSKSNAPKFWGTKNTRGTAIKSTSFADKDCFGCDFSGCELDKDYFISATQRFNEQTRQQALSL